MTQPNESLLPILRVLYAQRRRIVLITAAAFVLSILGSLLLKNRYQGKTVFYAASQDLFKPEKVFGSTQSDMYYYGSGEDIDRILTVGNAHEVIDFLIDSFDLWTVYKIKPGSPKARFKMRKAFLENYNIMLTKQDALELTIEDTDPQRAADMANAARNEIDRRVKGIIKSSQAALASSYQRSIQNKETVMRQLNDSLVFHRSKSGIYDPKGQTELLATRVTEISSAVERERATLASFQGMNLSPKLRDSMNVIKARISGYERELNILNGPESTSLYSLKNFNEAKGNIELLEARYARAYEQISYDLEKIKLYIAAIEIDVPAVHLIEAAEVPLYKHWPKRSVIVLAATLAAFLFSVALVLVQESYRRFDWRSITGA